MNYDNNIKNLPNGWEAVRFGDYLDIQGGSQPPKKHFVSTPKEGYIRLLQIRDFGKKPVPTYVPTDLVTKFCTKEDVFVARYGASLGRVLRGMDGAYNVALAKIIDEKGVFEKGYLFYLLQTSVFQTPIKMISRSAQNGFNKGDVHPIKIPLAPPEQQKRIVAKIEVLFSHIDAGIAALNKAKQLLKQYRQAVLKAAVTGELTKEWREANNIKKESWNDTTIGEIASVQTGKTPRRSMAKFWENGTIPWLTSSATNNVFTHRAEQFVTQVAVDEGLKLFEPGTILLAMYGEGKTRGQLTEITFQATCNQACAAIIVNEEKASREYVRLRLYENYEQIRRAASGGNQPNLNLSKVREIKLPLPLLGEQLEIITQAELKFEAIGRLENELGAQLLKAKKNKQSILKSAFLGELS